MCTFVQWKPSSLPVVLVDGHEQPVGVEPRLAAALGDVGVGPAALLGMPGERGVVDAQQFGVVGGSGVGGDAHAVGNGHGGRSVERPAHLQQLPHDDEAERGRGGAGGLEVAVRPDAGAVAALGQPGARHRRSRCRAAWRCGCTTSSAIAGASPSAGARFR